MSNSTTSVGSIRRQLKILHVLNHTGRANGHVCALVDLACTQAESGHNVWVCSGGGDFDDIFSSFNVAHVTIDQDRKPLVLVVALWKLMRLLLKVRPDIVHAHMVTSAILLSALRTFIRIKLVTSVHNEFEKSARLMGVGARVIGVSEAVSVSMTNRGILREKMRTVLNGTVRSPRFRNRTLKVKTLRRPAIVYVGGLHPRKGVPDLIHAVAGLKEFPEAHLYLVGSGPFEDAYRELAGKVAPNSITFCGHSDDPRSYLNGADIFVLPSHAEPAGLVISEAREAGCAVIASDVGGIPEMLDNGSAGILVPKERPDLIAKALAELIASPTYLATMRAKSQNNLENLSVVRVSDETLAVYRELLC